MGKLAFIHNLKNPELNSKIPLKFSATDCKWRTFKACILFKLHKFPGPKTKKKF